MRLTPLFLALTSLSALPAAATPVLLYDQDFENPDGFVDTLGIDISNQSVNSLYGDQPPGFTFAQQFTVETLEVNGDDAFGVGYSDPDGTAGNHLITMLSVGQDDRLGLSFNVGSFDFLKVSIDITSIDASGGGGPFVTPGAIPIFRFSLFDNPTGASGIGSGTALDFFDGVGTASDQTVIDFTELLFGLDASGSTNGNVILQVDLLDGGFAGFDNLVIAASDFEGEVPTVASPGATGLLGFAMIGLGLLGHQRRRKIKDHT